MREVDMTIYLASDHAGFEIKAGIKTFLEQEGYSVEDCGAYEYDPQDDYPDFISKAAKAVSEDPENRQAIIFGGSGQGEAIVANKFPDIRAGVFYGSQVPLGAADITGRTSEDKFEIIKLMRQHNAANVLSFATRFVTLEEAIQATKVFLETPISEDERHRRRIAKITAIEKSL